MRFFKTILFGLMLLPFSSMAQFPHWTINATATYRDVTIPAALLMPQIDLGDQFGVFFPNSAGGYSCAGFSTWSGPTDSMTIRVYQEVTQGDGGIPAGEPYELWYFDAGKWCEFRDLDITPSLSADGTFDTVYVSTLPTLTLPNSKDWISYDESIALQNTGTLAPTHSSLENLQVLETFSNTDITILPEGVIDLDNSLPGTYSLDIFAYQCVTTPTISFTIQAEPTYETAIVLGGPGGNDTYFISNPGAFSIYDRNGKVIFSGSAPYNWDGLDRTGALVYAGEYYINCADGTVYTISIIR